MRRIARSCGLAFILTLSFLLASSVSVAPPTFADNGDVLIADPSGDGGGGGSGDPDGPGGPNKRSPPGGRSYSPGGSFSALAAAGDGGHAMRLWSWRLHVVLRSLLSRWVRL